MATNDLVPSLIFKFNENQLALAAASNVRATLTTVDEIARAVAELMNDR